jgi:hypothetical protein
VDFDFSVEKVRKLLSELNTTKAAGPDDVHPLILAKAAEVLAYPIATLFRRSLDDGKIPEDWRTARMTPAFKKGSRLLPNNSRPVSLTSVLCKVMEKTCA